MSRPYTADHVRVLTGLEGVRMRPAMYVGGTDSEALHRMVLELLEELAVPAQRAIVVGDTTFDLEMARAAGVDRVAVSYGAHPVEKLLPCEPLAVIDRLHHLLPILGLAATELVTESL